MHVCSIQLQLYVHACVDNSPGKIKWAKAFFALLKIELEPSPTGQLSDCFLGQCACITQSGGDCNNDDSKIHL